MRDKPCKISCSWIMAIITIMHVLYIHTQMNKRIEYRIPSLNEQCLNITVDITNRPYYIE